MLPEFSISPSGSYVGPLIHLKIVFKGKRVSLTIQTTSKTAKICQTDLCNNETSLSDLEKWLQFLSNDITVFAFVNLGTVSNHFDADISLRERFILDGKKYYIIQHNLSIMPF